MSITIYHNPDCGTSRNTLALIRNSGAEPTIIYYLETPPSRDELRQLIAAMAIPVRALLRQNVEPYDALGLAEDRFTDDQLIDFMLQHPILMNRPIVVTPRGTRLCRPSEVVLEILPAPQKDAFVKEDGERVIDRAGQRVK
ncbi:TPA: glutaredoxin-dependent arsenate reductase [Klebsiella quasipneumoniae subsp. similipneumoniae]|uniref:glutaredoxin-dependent arsenate reductase n=1 Tax=Klebsiella quasipneumoniae TaxID=1463165 RepID=UPI00292AEE45|nr:glutaredoxin-dependent arsenate reductase [Klebsiella quasipneumoniae]MDV0461409.1 glutaredoxin-dependent arsenate reductase [Klebsiella quasipneumoniae subsp. similipneumoniae]MDV0823719.1 glutaredoxin-dependent arsenate reductase [Klebsiella quasipneumoniae subsp. similipneumoniae]MDV0864703.1 glutaredoxin-dependent arsenate reductase [Klebsiella quasipneumoniae subsp. similipneumoniae]HDH1414219.1 glutaredoxin-dependent arsenate reductase [Klebsiella quasipneumoniae subsp. similipneumonia